MDDIKTLPDRELLERIYEYQLCNFELLKNIYSQINMEDKDFVQNVIANILGDVIMSKYNK